MVPGPTPSGCPVAQVGPYVRGFLLLLCLALLGCGEDGNGQQRAETSACPMTCLPGEECNPITHMCELQSTEDQGADIADMADAQVDLDAADQGVHVDIPDLDEPVEDVADISDEDLGPIDTSEPEADLQIEPEMGADDPADEPETPPQPIPPVKDVTVDLRLPEGVLVGWVPPDEGVSGYRIERDDTLVSELEFPSLVSRVVTGLTPGEMYEFSVQAFVTTPQGRRYSDPVTESIEIPVPEALLLTPMTDLVLGSDATGSGQTEYLHVALYYGSSAVHPWAELIRTGVKRASAVVTFTSSNDSAATVSSLGVVRSDEIGTTIINVEYAWHGGSLEESIDVEVLDGVKSGLLALSIVVPEPVVGEGEEEPETPTFSVQVLGPSDVMIPSLEAGIELKVPLYAGTHHLIVSNPDLGVRRQVLQIVPGNETRVTVPWMGSEVCQTIDDDGGTIVAANGAVLDIPGGAIEDDTEVCITPLAPAEGPRRGPAGTYALTLPESYLISPTDLLLLEPATLAMPVAPDLANFIEIEFDPDVLPVYRYELIQWVAATVGSTGSVLSQDFVNVDLDRLGTYSAQICPGVGSSEDACRIQYDSCQSSRSVAVSEVTGAACGDIVTAFTDDHRFTITDVTDIDSPFVADLGAVGARAFGLHGDFVDSAVCPANPCGSGDTCAAQCRATAEVLSCGRGYLGSIERYDGIDGWEAVRDLEILVPVRSSCGRTFEQCAADPCLPTVNQCSATCLEGE